MSFLMFRMKCRSCGEEWNSSFGVVGTTMIATPSVKCRKCGSTDMEKTDDTWINDAALKAAQDQAVVRVRAKRRLPHDPDISEAEEIEIRENTKRVIRDYLKMSTFVTK